jgi:hypothetical protein
MLWLTTGLFFALIAAGLALLPRHEARVPVRVTFRRRDRLSR